MDRTQNYNRESKGGRGQAQVNVERQKTRTSGEDMGKRGWGIMKVNRHQRLVRSAGVE